MSKIEVDAIDKQSGSTLTLGGSGTAVTLACGATQTGFGRTGTVDWQASSIKTSTFTAASGEGYFCNTAGGSFEVDLPAGSAGAIVSIQDYNNTFDSNSLTIDPNGSEKINGGEAGGTIELTTEGEGVTLVYIDSTVGWRSIHQSTFADTGANPAFVAASGGNATLTCGDFKTHVFTGPGTFTVSCAGNVAGSNSVDYVVVAGGGGANQAYAAGGGAGGFRISNFYGLPSPTMSPLSNPTNLPVTATGFPVTIGSGGGASPTPSGVGNNGNPSVFSTITSTAGGGGGSGGSPSPQSCAPGKPGGSGGGGGGYGPGTQPGGTGNTPPVSPPQGNNGGATTSPGGGYTSGGGGGAGAAAVNVTSPGPSAEDLSPGGIGSFVSDSFFGPTAPSYGTPGPVSNVRYFSGGGGGGWYNDGPLPTSTLAPGGAGGGGPGTTQGPNPLPAASQNGTVNTGGGAGGGGNSAGGYGGGSGIVIIRYKFQ